MLEFCLLYTCARVCYQWLCIWFSVSRLFDSAKALAFSNVPTREQVRQSPLFITLIVANEDMNLLQGLLYKMAPILIDCSAWNHLLMPWLFVKLVAGEGSNFQNFDKK